MVTRFILLAACAIASVGLIPSTAVGDSVVQLVLVDADTDLDLLTLSPGLAVDLTSLPTTNLNIRAETDPAAAGSVRFDLNGVVGYRIESTAPFALAGDTGGDYAAWSPGFGPQTVVATAFTSPGASGTAGPGLSLSFTFVNGGGSSTEAPSVDAGPDLFPVTPTTTLSIAGTVSAGASPVSNITWSQLSGPAVSISGTSTPTPMLAGLTPEAIYQFQLQATDTAGRIATDQVVVSTLPTGVPGASLTGELKQWHRVTLTFDGPTLSETSGDNPFLNYRLEVSLTHNGKSVLVPGFFAADGNAAESSATSGSKWCAHYRPDGPGEYTYTALFRQGNQVAVEALGSGDPVDGVNGSTGTFTVGATDKTVPDFRSRGQLRYVGGRYLQFEGDQTFFLKGGADSPENFLAYEDFDGTYDRDGSFLHEYQPHVGDWNFGDPRWKGSKGLGIIGALNYLSDQGMNSVYFLPMNVNGDGEDVWPWIDFDERFRYDVSKLAQWEIVFSHMTRRGLALHVVTQETENDQLLDGGSLGIERRLYYRELIARFSHHPAIVWNMGEENTNTTAELISFSAAVRALDPYDHPITVHTYPNQQDDVWAPLLGVRTFEVASIQCAPHVASGLVEEWLDRSALAGRQWVVCVDEQNPYNWGVRPDSVDPDHDLIREKVLWPNLLQGGGGCEWYFGYGYPNHDINCEDWRSRQNMWDQTRWALEFFQSYLPFWEMERAHGLTSSGSDLCFAKPGESYAIYRTGSSPTTLAVPDGDYEVRWYDPRNGGGLQVGTVEMVSGPGSVTLGTPPSEPGEDWAILVRSVGSAPPPSVPFIRGDVNQDESLNLVDALLQLDVIFNGSANDCQDALDTNDSGTIDVADAVQLLSYLIIAGSAPPSPPFTTCGPDPSADSLSCTSFGCP